MVGIYSELKNLKVGSILDIATGHGGFLTEVCSWFNDYESAIGIDMNEKAVERANDAIENEKISFVLMNCEKLKYESESFDVVTVSNSIHHFENRDAILNEALRVLKKGGYFIVSEMFHSSTERPSQRTHSDFHHWWAEIDRANGVYHDRTFNRDELLTIVQSLPLDCIKFEQFDGTDEDIFSEDIKKQLTGAFEMYKDRTEKLDNKGLLIEKGEKLLVQLDSNGFSPASRLEFLCRK